MTGSHEVRGSIPLGSTNLKSTYSASVASNVITAGDAVPGKKNGSRKNASRKVSKLVGTKRLLRKPLHENGIVPSHLRKQNRDPNPTLRNSPHKFLGSPHQLRLA